MDKRVQSNLNVILDVVPIEVGNSGTSSADNVVITTTGGTSIPAPITPIVIDEPKTVEFDIDDELTKGKDTLEKLIEKSLEAVDGIAILANESEEPRAYEVLGELVDKTSGLVDRLMKLRREEAEIKKIEHSINKKDVVKESSDLKIGQQTNNMFFGNTTDLIKMIRDNQLKKDEPTGQ